MEARGTLGKTGTLTEGKPRLTQVIPANIVTEENLLLMAAKPSDWIMCQQALNRKTNTNVITPQPYVIERAIY
jgi:hypothetical protein